MRTVEVNFGKKQLTLDVDDKGQATLFETIVRYNSRRDALVEALHRVARHAEQEATAMECGYQVSGLGVFQGETTIVDARAGELRATHEAILSLASAIGFEL